MRLDIYVKNRDLIYIMQFYFKDIDKNRIIS